MKVYRSAIGFGSRERSFWMAMHFLRSAYRAGLAEEVFDTIGHDNIVGCGFENFDVGCINFIFFSDEASAMMFDLIHNPLTFWSQPLVFERAIEAEF
jgi:hypothetical protein